MLRSLAGIFLALISSSSGCATAPRSGPSLAVHWYFLDSKTELGLIRRDSAGAIVEKILFPAAHGDFCLSPSDAELVINWVRLSQ